MLVGERVIHRRFGVGTVVCFNANYTGIEFDNPVLGMSMLMGHDLQRRCKPGYGYWVDESLGELNKLTEFKGN